MSIRNKEPKAYPIYSKEVREFIDVVLMEYDSAIQKFGPFKNGHEGYAVLLEEVEEVWAEVKKPTTTYNLYMELVQVAAMALAMAVEVANE